MNYVAVDQNVGKPWAGDLVWSALPDAPVQEERPRFMRLRTLAKAGIRLIIVWNHDRSTPRRVALERAKLHMHERTGKPSRASAGHY